MRRSILIVDDNATFRAAARTLLEDEGYTCLPDAADGVAALAAVVADGPDVVLLDIALPGEDGIAVAGRLAELEPAPAVVLISSRPAAVYGRRLREAPVRGFVPKDELSGAAIATLLG